MEKQSGDRYLRDIAAFIRANERGLAESGFVRRKRGPPPQQPLFPWISLNPTQKPITLNIDTHHLFYILMRLQGLGFEIGTLDVHIDSPSRPMSYANIYPERKDTDTLSLASLRSSFSVVSSLSIGGNWWNSSDTLSIDVDLKFIYSSFTKLPSLVIRAPGRKVVAELMDEPPNHNAVPLDIFKNLQRLECENIDPRTLLGWDRLAESLRSLKIVRSGLQEISEVIIGAVLEDQNRREENAFGQRNRDPGSHHPDLSQVREESSNSQADPSNLSSPSRCISEFKWAFLKHLYLPDNSLTSFPVDILPHLTSLTHLDLSSNLLVSVPSGFGELYNLRSLTLADNLIDSVLGIYLNLGQILSLDLSHNRLESLCGLERLMALERIDLRHNLIDESLEIGRLAPLPNLSALFVEGNPFTEIEEEYRTTCFNYFWREGKLITLDGTQPSLYEKRHLTFQTPSHMIDSASTNPIVSTHSPLPRDSPVTISSAPPLEDSSQQGSHVRPHPALSPPGALLAPEKAGHRRRRPKRIVDLDENQSDYSLGAPSNPHSRLSSLDGLVGQELEIKPIPDGPNSEIPDYILPSQRPNHTRRQSEFAQCSPPNALFSNKPVRMGSATISTRAEKRRSRMAISVFEPSSKSDEGTVGNNIDSYRQQIESLKQDMGESWLKVFNQSEGT